MRQIARLCVLGATILGSLSLAAAAGARVYVLNSGSAGPDAISIYNIGSDGSLALAGKADSADTPASVAVSPDGSSLYLGVINDTVEQFTINSNGTLTPKTPASIAVQGADAIVVSPDGKSAYTTNDLSSGTLSQFDVDAQGRLTPKTPPTVPAGFKPHSIAIAPNGKSLYSASDHIAEGVLQYSIGTDGTLAPMAPPNLATANFPGDMRVSPDGAMFYLLISGGQVQPFTIAADGSLSYSSPLTVATGATFSRSLALTPDSKSLYLPDFFSLGVEGLRQFDLGSSGGINPKTPAAVQSGTSPTSVAIDPSGQFAYLGSDPLLLNDTIWQYRLGSGGVLTQQEPQSVAAGDGPSTIVVTPGRSPIASFTFSNASAGSPAQFNASASTAPGGSVARYDWNWGDGSSSSDAGASPTHTYLSDGQYTVKLTLTGSNGCSNTATFTGLVYNCVDVTGAATTSVVSIASGSAASSGADSTSSATTASPQNSLVQTLKILSSKLSTTLASGLKLQFGCNAACGGTFRVSVSADTARRAHLRRVYTGSNLPCGLGVRGDRQQIPGPVLVGCAKKVLTASGNKRVTVVLNRRAKKKLAQISQAKLIVRSTARGTSGLSATPLRKAKTLK